MKNSAFECSKSGLIVKPIQVKFYWSKDRTLPLRKIGNNPVRVWIRNRTGEDTQKVDFRLHSSARSKQSNVEVRDGAWSADANAHKEKSTAIQMGTDDTKGYSGGSDIVLYEVSTDVVTEHARNLLQVWVFGFIWEFVVKNNCKMSECSSPL